VQTTQHRYIQRFSVSDACVHRSRVEVLNR
jgi:hypothetical protein